MSQNNSLSGHKRKQEKFGVFFFSERGKICEVVLITGVDMLKNGFFDSHIDQSPYTCYSESHKGAYPEPHCSSNFYP